MIDSFKNVVYDTDYTAFVQQWWYPSVDISQLEPDKKKPTWLLWMLRSFFDAWVSWTASSTPKKQTHENKSIVGMPLKDQVQYLMRLPDEEYSDKQLTSELRKYILETDSHHAWIIADYKSHIAPSFWQLEWMNCNISGLFSKTYYVQDYPSYVEALRTRDILSFECKWDIWFFLYKEDSAWMQTVLRTKSTQIKAELNESQRKWITVDTDLELKYRDVETIRQKLATHEESYFELGMYITIYQEEKDKLNENGKKLEQLFSSLWVKIKPAVQRMDEWLVSTFPLCIDELGITRSSISTSLAWSFPFISSDIFTKTWILYGVNLHTWSLIIFDRFNSSLPNMNSVVLATSWAWKSFTVKLEIMRYLMNGIEVMVIDPENEYKSLCEKLGGTYINISTWSSQFINPFDLPPKISDRDYGTWYLLRWKIMDLIWLVHILIWWISAQDESILDKAIQTTYQLKWITVEEDDYSNKEIPIMQDLYNILDGMEWGEELALKLSKYVTWTFAKIFNNQTNVDVNNPLTVFSIRDLEDALKTPAMYSVLNYIWAQVRSVKKKRMLVCDEAWIMLQNDTSANFLFWLIKRARKYWLWITTISQDIEDFMKSKYGKPILSNSPFQILLKQSTTSIKTMDSLLWLSEAEKHRLVSSNVWEWLIFAWNQHVAIKVLASPWEKAFLTTDVA